jgi:hypothetical protein
MATAPDPAAVLHEVAADLACSSCSPAPRDIPALVGLLGAASLRHQQELAGAAPQERPEISERFWRAAVKTAELVVARPAPWLALPQEEVGRQVDLWQEEVDRAARTMGEHLAPDSPGLKSDGAGGVALELVVVGEGEQEHHFTGEGAKLSLHLQPEEEGEHQLIVFKSYRDLGCILNRQPDCTLPPAGEGHRVNSRVVGADLYRGAAAVRSGLTVSLVLEHTYAAEQGLAPSGAQCVWWDPAVRGWNASGCSTEAAGPGATRCSCSHLTNFAVLMDINGVLEPGSRLASVLSLLTVLCSSLSCLGLALSLLVFTLVPGLQSDRTTIHRHLCLTLLAANLVLLAGLDATEVAMPPAPSFPPRPLPPPAPPVPLLPPPPPLRPPSSPPCCARRWRWPSPTCSVPPSAGGW